ncbi:MAG: DUF3592 domain-containing protein [Anaerolineales bacterium]|nr:DUF3592 domain-containing protein [Anaerolineales bacterium]
MAQPILCPWCGTNYTAFRPNCKNCGGPMRLPQPLAVSEAEPALVMPPPAPRPIADGYVWKLMSAVGLSITGFVFAVISGTFAVLGSILTLMSDTVIVVAVVGIPFVLLGFVAGAGSLVLLHNRYNEMQKLVNVLRHGQPTRGRIVSTEANISVTINGRNPWNIAYQFQVNGREYTGKVSTLNVPGPELQPGRPAIILYLPESPEVNALYPHP